MKIGIKFCGGCNPRYDRGKEVAALKEKFPGARWVTEASEICDYWLISCGCTRECVNTDVFHARREVVKLSNSMDYIRAVDLLQAAMKETADADTKIREGVGSCADVSAGDNRRAQVPATDAPTEMHKGQQLRALYIGQKGTLEREITDAYIQEFAALTGDYNRLHTDDIYAEHGYFGRRIAHGMIAATLLIAVLGSVMPGDGGVMLEQQVRFHKPVFPGDRLSAEMTVSGYTENRKFYMVDFHGVCTNGAGDEVVTMEVRQMMSKKEFVFITNREDG